MQSADPFAHLAISNHGLRHSGGIERYALTLVRGLHARGIRPTLLAKAFDTALPEYAWVTPVPMSMRGVPGKLRDLYFDWRIGRAKRRLGLTPLIGCNQTRWSDIAICGSTHPGFLQAMGQVARTSDRWKINLERRHLESARVVVAHSARMRDEAVRHYGIAPDKVRLLYPPVDATRFTTLDNGARAAMRAQWGLPSDRAVFLLASTGHKRKGLDLLLDYFSTCTLPVSLVVAGRPMPEPVPFVRHLGYRSDMEAVYQAADFTLMASRYEPFGLVGVESVLCGTPVVLAENAGCAEVIGGPAGIRFDPLQTDTLDAAVRQAVARWQAGAARLDRPREHLAYDPDVAPHIEALLRLVAALDATARP